MKNLISKPLQKRYHIKVRNQVGYALSTIMML